MASNIDPQYPAAGAATTQSVRDNFQAARDEIEALQDSPAALKSGMLNAAIPSQNLTGGAAAQIVDLAVPTQQIQRGITLDAAQNLFTFPASAAALRIELGVLIPITAGRLRFQMQAELFAGVWVTIAQALINVALLNNGQTANVIFLLANYGGSASIRLLADHTDGTNVRSLSGSLILETWA